MQAHSRTTTLSNMDNIPRRAAAADVIVVDATGDEAPPLGDLVVLEDVEGMEFVSLSYDGDSDCLMLRLVY
ncbi:hypothetical protein DYB28_012373 [Aphanomyces astaci]|uniref:Uncharacterized protein n=1 Tax=Aphanomyces astaci TaxID=112090 RepID=A0A9X8ECN7_APHAT|nr:hypothetical protein DYB28_012373 [Aphanomyces astaci]